MCKTCQHSVRMERLRYGSRSRHYLNDWRLHSERRIACANTIRPMVTEMNRRRFVALAGAASLSTGTRDSHDAAVAKPLVVLPGDAKVYETGHGETRILVGGKESAGRWWLGNFVSDPGRKTSLHVHFSAEEQVYVVEGVLSLWIENSWKELPAGAIATAPRGLPHALGNRSQQPVRFLVAGEPAGFEHFFADLEVTARRFTYGSAEFLVELAKVYQSYDSKLIGPPPNG